MSVFRDYRILVVFVFLGRTVGGSGVYWKHHS